MNTKIKKALIFAPHPDDELNIAGQVMPRLVSSKVDCRICFSTNGDYSSWEAPTRHIEALKAAVRLGLKEDQVIFLGYGDALHGPHVYIEGKNGPIESNAGHIKAYVPDGEPFSQQVRGKASLYDRASFIGDIRGVVEKLLPDLIICVDYDSHPDHKALSLGFEQAMSQILAQNRSYRPIVLKKFAYVCSWKGPEDYWAFAPCSKPVAFAEGYPFALPNPTYSWEERLRLSPDSSTVTLALRRNVLYKAARAHKTQLAWVEAVRICNSDVVYWLRRTDNLLFEGRIAASSGDVSGIDGFSRFDVGDIGLGFNTNQFIAKGWKPEQGDDVRRLTVDFPTKRILEEGRITISPAVIDQPEAIGLQIDGHHLEARCIDSTCCYGFVNPSNKCERFEIILDDFDGITIEAIELYECSAVDSELLERLYSVLPEYDDISAGRLRQNAAIFPRFRIRTLHLHAFFSRYIVRANRRFRRFLDLHRSNGQELE